MAKLVWYIPKEVLIKAVNDTLREFAGHCVDKWGEEEASHCRKLCGPEFRHIETDWIRERSITLRKAGRLDSVNGGSKRKKRTAAQGRYAEYLASDHWRSFSKMVMEFWGYKCCLCSECADDVHHNTYQNRGCELLTDCVALCRKCHSRIHAVLPDGNEEMNDMEEEACGRLF